MTGRTLNSTLPANAAKANTGTSNNSAESHNRFQAKPTAKQPTTKQTTWNYICSESGTLSRFFSNP